MAGEKWLVSNDMLPFLLFLKTLAQIYLWKLIYESSTCCNQSTASRSCSMKYASYNCFVFLLLFMINYFVALLKRQGVNVKGLLKAAPAKEEPQPYIDCTGNLQVV